MQMNAKYMCFYLEGCEDPLDTDELDQDGLAEMALAGPDDVHTIVARAVGAVARPLEHDRERREWIADSKEEIDKAGGDGALAYEHYLKGRTDEATRHVENEVVELMYPESEDEDDEDEDDEDEDDEDEDEEEDDEED